LRIDGGGKFLKNVVSLFDGISCLQIALGRASIPYENYYASEIDKHCITITQKNYPSTIEVGNICDLTKADFPSDIDLLVGGSPCQGFSFMGNQLNFNDGRSKLFFEYVRLWKELKPKYFILENVKMRKDIQQAISDILGVQPIEINSALFSGQNRRRLYWTNIPNVVKKLAQKLGHHAVITGKSLLTDNSYEIATVRKGNPRQVVKPATDKLPCLTASYYKGINADGRPGKAKSFGDYEIGKIEMLSPVECERMQTVPEGYTEGVAKTHRYKALGNGFTVDVITFILSCIS
jgi:site-specific DNA-cytosine methylase